MHTLATAAALAVALAAVPADAQTADTKVAKPGTQAVPGAPAADQANATDRVFVELVGTSGKAEVEFARLADRKAQNGGVKDFAHRMADDHTKTNEQLAMRAQGANISVPQEPGPDHKTMLAQLERATGPAFDLAYIQGQIAGHQKMIALMEYEIDSGQNAALKQFASETLPTILRHLDSAKDVMADLARQGVVLAASDSARDSSR